MTGSDTNRRPVRSTTLTPLELATNKVYGLDPDAPPLPRSASGPSTLAALEAAVLPAVSRPPCVVTFSGGRDSSLVLAVAARVARREGLPPPLPATLRFVGMAEAEESVWQELVIRHLELEDWIRLDVATDLDLVGPLAQRVLLRHGVLWPLNIYLHESLIGHARGGAVMTGMHGDAVFAGGRWLTASQLLGRRRRPRPRDMLRLGLALAPGWAKRPVLRRRLHPPRWLRPDVRDAFIEARSRSESEAPVRWDRWMDNLARRRSTQVASASMQLLAADAEALVVQPLADRAVMASMARAGGAFGMGDRTATMRSLFTDLLPDALLARPDKAVFSDAFVGRWTRQFVETWDGGGVDPEVVDPDVLAAVWAAEPFDFRTALLLQSAWLHAARS